MLLPLFCGLVGFTLPQAVPRLAAAGEVVKALNHDRCAGRCRQSDCGKPGCPAHCPVRPDRFGFYGTQWRKWQGEGVVQASHSEAATPVRPRKSEVPTADEESPAAPESLDAQGEDNDAGLEPEALPPGEGAAPQIPAPPARRTEPFNQPPREQPEAPAQEPEPPTDSPPADSPPAAKPAAPAADENLFDEATHQRRRSESLAKLQQQVIINAQRRPEARRYELSRLQPHGPRPIRPQASGPTAPEAPTQTGEPAAVRTVAHDEPSGRAKLPPQRPHPLR